MPESTSASSSTATSTSPRASASRPTSPPRTSARSPGVLAGHGYAARYVTIDQVRADPSLVARPPGRGDLVVMIAGLTVPGAYIGGKPATLTEIQQLGILLRQPTTAIGGPIAFGYAPGGGKKAIRQAIAGFDVTLSGGSPAVALDSWLSGGGEPAGAGGITP